MSFIKKTRSLLEGLNREFPLTNKMRHNITIKDGKVILTVVKDDLFWPIDITTWNDEKQSVFEVITEIKNLFKKQELNKSK